MWLLEQNVKQSIESGFIPTAEQQAQFTASHLSAASEGGSRILTVAGNSAEIAIEGVLTKAPNFMAMLFGGGNTTYAEITSALAEAEQDPTVTDITLAVDSPGGSIDGLFDTIAAIQNVNKPIKAVISNLCASAAYALVSQVDKITATNAAARIGSIGIAASFSLDDNEVTVTSTAAPKKRPDVTTEAGKAAVREELDALHEIFVDAIATGRGTTIENINANYGQGATLLAGEAQKRGMIDSSTITTLPIQTLKATKMDIKELFAQHPKAYQAAVQRGVDQERDRVGAHLTMGEASGDTKTAFAAIRDGSAMTATLQATYMTAGMNRSDINNRDDDNPDLKASKQEPEKDAGDEVAGLVEAKLGIGA